MTGNFVCEMDSLPPIQHRPSHTRGQLSSGSSGSRTREWGMNFSFVVGQGSERKDAGTKSVGALEARM
jgi:hypothetical protein